MPDKVKAEQPLSTAITEDDVKYGLKYGKRVHPRPLPADSDTIRL
jgi:hypothetical protein